MELHLPFAEAALVVAEVADLEAAEEQLYRRRGYRRRKESRRKEAAVGAAQGVSPQSSSRKRLTEAVGPRVHDPGAAGPEVRRALLAGVVLGPVEEDQRPRDPPRVLDVELPEKMSQEQHHDV